MAASGANPGRPRTIVYVDGFNLYYRCLKPKSMQWLNIQSYFKKVRSDDDIVAIDYFTAPLTGAHEAAHEDYLRALDTLDLVNIVRGKYQIQHTDCEVEHCSFAGNRQFFKLKEKRTDVNIAIQMVDDAHRNKCDQLILVSGDSDLVPAVKLVRDLGKR